MYWMRLIPQLSKRFITTVICAIVAGITRILYCWVYPVPVRDSFAYKEIIEYWIRFGSLPEESHSPPLGLLFFKIPAEYFDYDVIKTGIAVNVLLGVCIVISIVWIAYVIGLSNMESLLVGIIAATHPTLVKLSCQMIREDSYLLFCSLSILTTFLFLKNRRNRQIILMSLFAASAYLCRHEGLELIPIICLLILVCFKDTFFGRTKRIILFLGLYAVSIVGITCTLDIPIDYYKAYVRYSISINGNN